MKVRVLRIALFAAASVLLASCGAILEEATERAVERGLEEGGVDVDLDDLADGEFEVTVTDENGEEATIQIDGDEGVLEIDSEDGEGTFSVDSGLADGWPDEFALPDDAVIVSSVSFEEEAQSTFQAIFTAPPGSLERYYEHVQAFDLPIFSETNNTTGDVVQRAINWGTDDEQTGTFFISDDGQEIFGQITLVITN